MYQYFAYAALILTSVIAVIGVYSLYKKRVSDQKGILSSLNHIVEGFLEWAEKYWYIPLALIFIAFLASRLLRLGLIPGGFQADEMGSAYDAQNLLNYHVDRYLTHFPVYLRNNGDGQNALYAYLSACMFSVTGFSVKAFRLVAVICAIPCFFCSWLIAKDLFHSKAKALLAPILVTILPVFMMSERWGLECYLFLSFMTISFWFFCKAIKSNQFRFYFLTGLFFGITLYSYAISYFVIPLFLFFSILYLVRIKKFSLKNILVMGVPLAVLATPLILFQLVNLEVLPEFSFLFTEFKRLPGYRSGDVSFIHIAENWSIIRELLFGDNLRYNAFPEYGTLYIFSIPLLIYGCIICIRKTIDSFRKREFDIHVLIMMLLLVADFVATIILDPNINKANEIFLPLMLIVAIALEHILSERKTAAVMILLCYAIAFLSFSNFYFRHYNDPQYEYLNFEDTEFGNAIAYLNDHYEVDGRPVYCATQFKLWGEMMLLTYGGVSPYDWQHHELQQGNYYMDLPADLTLEEDCVYIIDNYWRHVSDYLGANGYYLDDTFPNYAILYREPLQ